ncbi:roadblock/LC7 domain-containing protein [Calditrichota bacterium]
MNLEDINREMDILESIQEILNKVLAEAGALGVFLVDNDGFLVAEAGAIEIERVPLAALVAATFGATVEIAKILGEADFDRLAHQGNQRSLFIGKTGNHHILVIIFGSETNLGLVKLYAEQFTKTLAQLLDKRSEVAEEAAKDENTESENGMTMDWMKE